MKTRTSLALILAGIVGTTSCLGIIYPHFQSKYDKARNSIPSKLLEAKKELDKMGGRTITHYQVLGEVFESEESEIRFEDLYQRAREYMNSPRIQAAESKMKSLDIYMGLTGALFTASLISGCFGIEGLLPKKRKNELGITDA
ncbi:MAG: hypothetical protein AABX54_00880 [Nanoarchaeota archaeon]